LRMVIDSRLLTKLDNSHDCRCLRQGLRDSTVRWLTSEGNKAHLEREPPEVHEDLFALTESMPPQVLYELLKLHNVIRTKMTRSIIWPHGGRDYDKVRDILNADVSPIAKRILTKVLPWAFDRNGELYADIKDFLKHDPVSSCYQSVCCH